MGLETIGNSNPGGDFFSCLGKKDGDPNATKTGGFLGDTIVPNRGVYSAILRGKVSNNEAGFVLSSSTIV